MQVASSSLEGFGRRNCKMFLVVCDAGDLESERFRGEKRGQDVLMYFGRQRQI